MRRKLGALAALVTLAVSMMPLVAGANHPATSDAGVDIAWINDMNEETYWENLWDAECTKFEGHNGSIPAQYDAAVIKSGSTQVHVYSDLTNTGAFTAIGPPNPNDQHPNRRFEAPFSWVMKCTFNEEPETDVYQFEKTWTGDLGSQPEGVTVEFSVSVDGELVTVKPGEEIEVPEGTEVSLLSESVTGLPEDCDYTSSTEGNVVNNDVECEEPDTDFICSDGEVIEMPDGQGDFETREEAEAACGTTTTTTTLPDETTTTTLTDRVVEWTASSECANITVDFGEGIAEVDVWMQGGLPGVDDVTEIEVDSFLTPGTKEASPNGEFTLIPVVISGYVASPEEITVFTSDCTTTTTPTTTPPSTSPASTLPFTGMDNGLLVGLGASALALGALLIFLGTRREEDS